jgi:putative aldouronate transport system substrate-binding protein
VDTITWGGYPQKWLDVQDHFEAVQGSDWLFIDTETGEPSICFSNDAVADRYRIARSCREKGFFHDRVLDGLVQPDDVIRLGELFCYSGMEKPGEAELEMVRKDLSEVPTMIKGIKPAIITFSTICGMGIVSYSQQKEATMQLMNLLWSNEEFYNIAISGIEGKHYVKDDRAYYWKKLPEGSATPDDTGYNCGFFWQLGNDMMAYIWDNEPADKHEQYQIFNDSGAVSKSFGFYFDTEKVVNEMSAVQNTFSTYRDILDSGKAENVDEVLEEATQKCFESGLQKIYDELTSQYLAWRETQK